MKVVLFCGGLGTRIREYSDTIPKPMIPIGYRPMLWHLMKYYAHFGHREFILCLGYRGDVIKQYFLNYDECLSNDFVLSKGGRDLTLRSRDIQDWTVTFVDTGLHSNLGQRLKAVAPYLDGDEMFLANYSDGLTDLCLPGYVEHFRARDSIASFIAVRPKQTFHVVAMDDDGMVQDISHVGEAGLWINAGFFIFKREIFDHMREGEELVEEPFRRLIAARRLITYPYNGFWACMDTFKDKQMFDDVNALGNPPWEVWRSPREERALPIVTSPSLNGTTWETPRRPIPATPSSWSGR
jgi:glucose-1-phosphate cytidylyltransferase